MHIFTYLDLGSHESPANMHTVHPFIIVIHRWVFDAFQELSHDEIL